MCVKLLNDYKRQCSNGSDYKRLFPTTTERNPVSPTTPNFSEKALDIADLTNTSTVLTVIPTANVNNAKFQKELTTFFEFVQPTNQNGSNLSEPRNL